MSEIEDLQRQLAVLRDLSAAQEVRGGGGGSYWLVHLPSLDLRLN